MNTILQFNRKGRIKNALRTSIICSVCNLINVISGFAYITAFLRILSTNYLGINGLFANVLGLLSFADLGIYTAIIYRFYEPISRNDVKRVGQLVNFLKYVYRIITLIIFVLCMALYPFLDLFINDADEIPADVNIQLVYILFMIKTLSSYMFVYKQTILSADQKQYIISFWGMVMSLVTYFLQLVFLVLYKDYTLNLCIGIVSTVIMNFVFSNVVAHKYRNVYEIKDELTKEEKKQILEDTKATLCHKVGGTVLNSTDNIVLSSFLGLVATGVYSNYSRIITGVNNVLGQILGSFTSTLGNAHVEQGIDDKYISYRRLMYANLWISCIATTCLYTLIDDFVYVWIGKDMMIDNFTVAVLSIKFYLETTRYISTSYINGCGLFVKDKMRPIIESVINISVSILLVIHMGIAGVFIGTIISHLCTVFWREPYLLFKYEFKRSSIEYWKYFIWFSLITIIFAAMNGSFWGKLISVDGSLIIWLTKAILVFIFSNLVLILLSVRNSDFRFFVRLLVGKINADS